MQPGDVVTWKLADGTIVKGFVWSVLDNDRILVQDPVKSTQRWKTSAELTIVSTNLPAPTPTPAPSPVPTGAIVVTPATVSAEIDKAVAGTVLALTRGTYRLPVVSGKNGIELRGIETGVELLAGPDGSALSLRTCTNMRVSGMRLKDAIGSTSTALYVQAGCKNVVFEDLEVGPTPRQGVFTERDTDALIFRRMFIHHCYTGNDPNRIHGMYLNGRGHVVEDCVIEDIESFGIQVYPAATGMLIQRNTLRRIGKSGVLVGTDGADTTRDITISRNYFEACGSGFAVDSYKLTTGKNVVASYNTAAKAMTGAFTVRPGVTYLNNTLI